ncbi:hypothetical protein FRC04_007655 [Tulasnella sp. 424]|nr:hypothetical protein FRC04_007655 [Tulasnella sp. 424]KAG8979086.1 hypothetical protein FRC05_009296 [Tulasnella sp. 425]
MDDSLLSRDDEPQVIVRSQKGKVATKGSWTDLPPEVLSHVANILFMGTYNFWVGHPTPSWRDWSAGKQPHLWATLMALQEISSIRLVCMNWQAAMEVHQYYSVACNILDPQCLDSQYYPPLPRLPPQQGGALTAALGARRPRIPTQRTYTTYARTFTRCCLPCRFNAPHESKGVNMATSTMWSRYFGNVGICDRHRPEQVCGFCLKDYFLDCWKYNNHGQPYHDQRNRTIMITEDDDYCRGIIATCRPCRSVLIRGLVRNKIPRHAADLTDSVLDTFIECGEGNIKDLLGEVDEKVWLANHTNYRELHDSALAVERMRLKQELRAEREAEGYMDGRVSTEARLEALLDSGASPEEIEDALQMQAVEEEEDDELLDDEYGEVLTAAEEANVNDMAISGWARNRIMDGCWLSPLDIWHGDGGTRARTEILQRLPQAWHPVNSYLNAPDPAAEMQQAPIPQNQMKPRLTFIRCPYPPPRIFQRAQTLYEYSFRQIVSPALNNLVQRVICEAEAEHKDVCRVVTCFSTDTLLEEMRTIQLWGKDYDWANLQTSPTITSTTATFDSVSERSRGSPASTLTTPSPSPPALTSPKSPAGIFAAAQNDTRLPPPPAVVVAAAAEAAMPLPDRYLDHIPHIPRAPEHMGTNTRQLLEGLWKDAIAGLFKCQCSICLRASGIAEAREAARRKAREEEEARDRLQYQQDNNLVVKRESAPPPPSPGMEIVADSEVEEDGEVRSPPVSPTPLRRSREATEDEAEDPGRETKRQRITPPADTEDPRRRAQVERHEASPMSIDEALLV